MIGKAEIKNMVHDAAVLDYIMDQCGFYCMRVYEAPHKFNVFKIRLYKADKALSTHTGSYREMKGSMMTYGDDGQPHVFTSSDPAFRDIADYKVIFSGSFAFEHVQMKSMLLDIIKQSNGFKFQNEEHMRNGKLDEILVNADIDTAYIKQYKQYEDDAVNAMELQMSVQTPF